MNRVLRFGVNISKMPFTPAHPVDQATGRGVDDIYGRGDAADFGKLSDTFNDTFATLLFDPRVTGLVFKADLRLKALLHLTAVLKRS